MATNMLKVLMILLMFIPLIFTASVPVNSHVETSGNDLPHPLGVMRFSGSIQGIEVQLDGTVQEIHTQFKARHPEAAARHEAELTNATIDALDTSLKLNRRNKILPPICIPVPGQPWDRCFRTTIYTGITYLQSLVPGICGVGARSCVRISCSYDAAIILCNDNYYDINPACNYLSSYAQDITDDCSVPERKAGHKAGGQVFDTDDYNIIVRRDGC